MSDRPGVVLYFDVLPALKYLEINQMGRLFQAILEYGENGKIPDFSDDPILGLAWCFIGPRIDRDGESYGEKQDQRKYAVYCREAKKNGVAPLSFDNWKNCPEDERKRSISTDDRKVSTDNENTTENRVDTTK